MEIKHKLTRNAFRRAGQSYFNDAHINQSYLEQDGACIYSCAYVLNLEQRYLNDLCFYYMPKNKKLYLVAFTGELNDKIDPKDIIKSFNNYSNNGNVKCGVTKLCDLWNISPCLTDNFGKLEEDDGDTLCVYQEFSKVGVFSIRKSVRKFRKALDLYNTSKSKKIRSLYNQLGTLVLHFNNGHE